jgi:beta-lactamase class D/beta-lactamase class A
MSPRCWSVLLAAVPLISATSPNETFVLLDGGGKLTADNQERARRGYTPCSTFKIPNSLIVLETGVASDPGFTLEYDPKRDGEQYGAWNRDLDLRSALRESAAWYYRELARRVGPQRMRQYLDRFDYGNADMSGGIDGFWIGGGLRISAKEQVRFLQRFRENRLGIPLRTTATVQDMLLLETTPVYRWYGKTGTCTAKNEAVAWHVGFVERAGAVIYYALNFGGGPVRELYRRRPALIRARLHRAGLIDAQPPGAAAQVRARIQSAIDSFPATVSLFATNLDSGETFAIRPDERVRTASTIKLPIMAAAFAAVAEGRAKWDDTLELREQDKIGGSGVLREFSDGLRVPLRDLVHLMIVVSDNTATNLVLDRITADYVNAQMDKYGVPQTRALRKVLRGDDTTAAGHSREGLREEFRRFGLGVSTPREMVALLGKIERREVVSPEASREMLAILQRQQYKDGIGRRLPSQNVASKSGSLDLLRSDVGLVRYAGGRLALAITVDGMRRTDYSPENAGSILISELTGMLLDGLSVPLANLGEPEKIVELKAAMDHVQGIEIEGERLWVTWVDRKRRTGHLSEFELATGKLLRSIPVHEAARYHPGGLAASAEALWLPVAEYRPGGSSVIQRRNKRTLAVEQQWEVPDHIGCVAAANRRLYGGNWDARQLYVWDESGRLLDKRDNPAGARYQDMKFAAGHLVASGLRGNEGAIDWLDPQDFRLLRRIRAGKTNRGVPFTLEGMALSAGRLYLLPEDAPSRLFTFVLQ